MSIEKYIEKLNTRFKAGISTEHSYRGDLQNLLEAMLPEILVTNEPSRIACGAPDYILTKKGIPIGYIEAKDLGADLGSKNYKEQFDRYRASLNNLIITDYLDFWLYRDGELVTSIAIASIENGKIAANSQNFTDFNDLIKDFGTHVGQTISSSEKLSKMMAGKARMLATVIENAIISDEAEENENQVNEAANITLREQLAAFKDVLIHDITPKGFADIYAQTIAYGMFAARLRDPTLETFSRQEAAELIPKTNPFLRRLFQYIAGYDLDDRIKWIVDGLAEIFRATDVAALLKDFGKTTQQHDPIIHFYETFLAEYDPKLRKSRGVWYTPAPVVKFIVRAVDDILKSEFGIKDGLADTSKTKVKIPYASHDKRKKLDGKKGYTEVEQEVHKVQILDPAVGTGTFLVEVIKTIYKNFKGQQGIWSKYVDNHLIPRLNGFEILMASYAMAHLKLDLILTETGYKSQIDQRFRVYLTNSLEEHHPDTGTLFAGWLSSEANEANHIKRDAPVMVVLGNPPYAVSSSNKGDWIQSLLIDYKRNLNERKINLDDDYIKFIRYGQFLINKNGEGILAYISNNSFIDGITHRQMRKELLATFDKIYVLDLHGSAKKQEKAADGGKDENVFDIQQGVAINLFIRTSQDKSDQLAEVFHLDLFGSRVSKYETLSTRNISQLNWEKLVYTEPNYFFIPRNYDSEKSYNQGFPFNEIFVNNNSGIQTKNDALTINMEKNALESIITDFNELEVDQLKTKYDLKDTSGWTAKKAKDDVIQNQGEYYHIYYRPFDVRHIYMTKKSGGFVGRPRLNTMRHFFKGSNYGLITVRQQSTFDFQHILVTDTLIESGAISLQTKEWGYIFPLYIYPDSNGQQKINFEPERKPNLNEKIVDVIATNLELDFTNEKQTSKGTFAPIDILDYIYAVLHSPTYRKKYKEFLKIDFPRIPYIKDQKLFWQLVKLGAALRQIHLLESPKVEKLITAYPKDGNNSITRKIGKKDFEIINQENGIGRIWINDNQYFDKVPRIAWEFYIGGYQPAQKWLKDRKGRTLSVDDIFHYQKIIVALTETERIMKEIDVLTMKWL